MGTAVSCRYGEYNGGGDELTHASSISDEPSVSHAVHLVKLLCEPHAESIGRIKKFDDKNQMWKVLLLSGEIVYCKHDEALRITTPLDIRRFYAGQVWIVNNLFCNEAGNILTLSAHDPDTIWSEYRRDIGDGGIHLFKTDMDDEDLADVLFEKISLLDILPKRMQDGGLTYQLLRIRRFLSILKFSKPKHGFGARIDPNLQLPNGLKSFWTILIFLNDNFDGGGIQFPQRDRRVNLPLLVKAVTGKCIIIRQGAQQFKHEALPISFGGSGYLLHANIMYKATYPYARLGGTPREPTR